ncbi:MAG: hypothetical protein U9O20_04765 [Patescibacteria group bacterium]|nr:hypothetical protein [Patescibacteria group bacterium]
MSEWVVPVITYVGIPTIIGMFIWIERKLEMLNNIKTDITRVESNLKVVCDSLIKDGTMNFDLEKLESYSPL